MDPKTALLIWPKLQALRAFIKSVGTAGQYLPDNATRATYREMYADIKKTLDDPALETYAPPLPHLGTTGDESTLWGDHQIRIMASGNSLIAYLEGKLAQAPGSLPQPTRPLRCFLSYRFGPKANAYADGLRHFLELVGVEVITGDRFEPRSVSDKINELLSGDLDFGILIIAEGGESMWTRDEVNALWNDGKYVIVLVVEGEAFTPGLQADLEWIAFPDGHISEAYVKLLEGIKFIRRKRAESAAQRGPQTP